MWNIIKKFTWILIIWANWWLSQRLYTSISFNTWICVFCNYWLILLFFWVNCINMSLFIAEIFMVFYWFLVADFSPYNWFVVERYALYAPHSWNPQFIFFFLCWFCYRFTKLLKDWLILDNAFFIWRVWGLFIFSILLTNSFFFCIFNAWMFYCIVFGYFFTFIY